jgi:hypothetical protein
MGNYILEQTGIDATVQGLTTVGIAVWPYDEGQLVASEVGYRGPTGVGFNVTLNGDDLFANNQSVGSQRASFSPDQNTYTGQQLPSGARFAELEFDVTSDVGAGTISTAVHLTTEDRR